MKHFGRVQDNGEVVLPASLARLIGLKPGDDITLEQDGTNIVVKTYAEIVREGQRAFRALITHPFTVDDFLADRRAEAADE